jgi:Spy/CpxP family protein refolding chaperone
MFKKAIGLTLILSLALISGVLAQLPMNPGAGTPNQGMRRGMFSPGNGMRMGQGMGMGRGMGPGMMAIWNDKELLKKAGISEAQANKIREMHFQNQKDQIKLGSDLRIKQLEMAELMDADKPDDGKILAKAKEVSDLREKLYLQGVQQRLAMKKLITPEQEEKLRDALQGRHTVIERRMEMRFGMGPEMMPPDQDMDPPQPQMPEAPEPEGMY